MRTEAFYRQLLDSISDGIYFMDRDNRVTFWSSGAERIAGYTASEVVGQRCSDNILMHVDSEGRSLCLSECPARRTMACRCTREQEIYIHHKNGHRIPVHVKTDPIVDENGEVVGAVEIFRENSAIRNLRDVNESLRNLALVDQMTNVPNRNYISMTLDEWIGRLDRAGIGFGLLFVDIDNFKHVNDHYGHRAGDIVLQTVATTLASNVRVVDRVGRWGGEEFIVLLFNITEGDLLVLGNKLRTLIARSSAMADGTVINVTISLGGTTVRTDDTIESVIARADELMYRSKRAGRNRITTDTATLP